MNCQHHKNGRCEIASQHAGRAILVTDGACQTCQKQNPPKDLNRVTASLAVSQMLQLGETPPNHLLELCVYVDPPNGVGTILKGLISWFPIPKKKSCGQCRSLERRMNMWGPDKCEQKIKFIVKKLSIAAARRKIPFSAFLAEALVKKAIRNSRR